MHYLYVWLIVQLRKIKYLKDSLGKNRTDDNMESGNLPDNMLTVSEVARILHVHPNTLRRWSDKGIIKSYSVTTRGDRRFMPKDINQFLANAYTQNH